MDRVSELFDSRLQFLSFGEDKNENPGAQPPL